MPPLEKATSYSPAHSLQQAPEQEPSGTQQGPSRSVSALAVELAGLLLERQAAQQAALADAHEAPTRPGTPTVNAHAAALQSPARQTLRPVAQPPRDTHGPLEIEPWVLHYTGLRMGGTKHPPTQYYSERFWMMERTLKALAHVVAGSGELRRELVADLEARVANHTRSGVEMSSDNSYFTASPLYDQDNPYLAAELDRDLAELKAARDGMHRYCFLPAEERRMWEDFLQKSHDAESGDDDGVELRRACFAYELELVKAARFVPEREGELPLSYKRSGTMRTVDELTADRNAAEIAAAEVGYHRYANLSRGEARTYATQLRRELKHEVAIAGQAEFDAKSRRNS